MTKKAKEMRFNYSRINLYQDEFEALPRLTLSLQLNNKKIDVIGLVDSGSTINVLPYEIGIQLGIVWNMRKATIQMGGNFSNLNVMPLFVTGYIENFAPVNLSFAWVNSNNIPVILGQTNFFMEFDVCFYRSEFEFEIRQKSYKNQ